ncbi:MAG: hypothetical protein COX65_07440 [Elusimicrobia bacterium CG_4_10_14_0_2_um_filter_56_8]|nr:MAG: hypothetical protein AUJ51_05120 [Elusimicrobia bacterium CG1_02_56_21]PJA13256.1 MAG: hypothetical protein COX65_07440 [Elusimicrobia bacterium CG_4_10_14_0_2_um_filter_56_8]
MARPPEFDREQVLEKVMLLFWERGFAGTSLAHILKATGLQKGSLYRSFGNKEKLFSMALRRYAALGPPLPAGKSRAIDKLVFLYRHLIAGAASPASRRRACLIFNSGLEFGACKSSLTAPVMAEVRSLERFFLDLLLSAHKAGEIPRSVDPAKAAVSAFAAAFTILEIAKFRPEREFLAVIADQALEAIGTGARV